MEGLVVIEMVILTHSSNFQNCIKKTNKIPEYAREYKKEYLLIIGINKEFKYFVENIDDATRGLFENHKVVRIKYFIKRFLKGQERGKLQDISSLEIESSVVYNLIKIKKNFLNFNQYINFCKSCFDDEDASFIDPYPGFKNIYDDFELFCSKFKKKNMKMVVVFGIIVLIVRVIVIELIVINIFNLITFFWL